MSMYACKYGPKVMVASRTKMVKGTGNLGIRDKIFSSSCVVYLHTPLSVFATIYYSNVFNETRIMFPK